ncbi:(deoxy)nucleoside triphosphate pyrophosphohydrolase [Brevibacillus choshinensis]|uniref:(deoxy)nucleoside triphosphate pyrophosphohydrolase n=1 Tax=Brevibacillus choshinensis TaxID=54911 RepID=UPI000B24CA1C|nr:(deoxy)nucleoside triphosphate pyrophosphohydrolase [Brevibacillus choshinensis]
MWEFPGGKIEQGETVEACLQRELREEMNISITPYEPFGVNDHFYGSTHNRLFAHMAKYISGEISLVDHDEYRWVERDQLQEYLFVPADIKFVEMLQKEA